MNLEQWKNFFSFLLWDFTGPGDTSIPKEWAENVRATPYLVSTRSLMILVGQLFVQSITILSFIIDGLGYFLSHPQN